MLLLLICTSCGDTFRPVAIPLSPSPPDPSSFHYVIVISDNAPSNPGGSSRIDVSGDTNVGVARVGLAPSHAALLPNGARLYVANSGEDTVSSYSPSLPGAVTTTSLPAGAGPVFVHTTQNDTVFVANAGIDEVAAISAFTNVVTNRIAVGVNPIALAEIPSTTKLYVVNQGSDSVTSINTLDKTVNATIPTGSSPVWAVARSDSARVYVLNSASGTVSVIDTVSDSALANVFSVGAGANFMAYDSTRNRVYVTNPTANTVSVLDVSTDPPLPVSNPLFVVSVGAHPVSVAPLPDGSRAYVASVSVSGGNAVSLVTVINATDGSVRTTVPLGSVPAICGASRFELFIAAAASGARVYVGNCDAGTTAIIRTVAETTSSGNFQADTLVLNLPAPVSSFPAPSPGEQPPPQNPVFVLAGP